ncbi:hypothetical protein SLS60_002307 [Paraconiothyrium brasiliense]|uniref:Uncharacterized protein n=1 Tax=Paraconiothyrium brasiliense TaxID=300254 RepID=A0ABR3S1T2_9PLEO
MTLRRSRQIHANVTMPSFFTLPREIRNEIYHHLFINNPYLSCNFYSGLHLITRYSTYCCPLQPICDTYNLIPRPEPIWLLTSKTLMREALAQYSLHASSIYDESSSQGDGSACLYKLPLDRSKIRRLEITVSLLSGWHVPRTSSSQDPRQEVRVIAEASREAGISFESVRLQGFISEYEMERLDAAYKAPGQVARIFEDMRMIFEGVEVREWFLEVSTLETWKTEVVFARVGEEVAIVEDGRGTSALRGVGFERKHTERCTVFIEETGKRLREERQKRNNKAARRNERRRARLEEKRRAIEEDMNEKERLKEEKGQPKDSNPSSA